MPALFSDQVRVDRLVEWGTLESQRLGDAMVTDLRTRDRSLWLPYTFVVWLNELEVSGNASRAPDPADQP